MENSNRTTEHAGYVIKKAESRHIPLLNAIELAAATLFPEDSLPEHILSDKLPMDMLFAGKEQGMLWVAVDAEDSPVGYILLQAMEGIALLAQIDVHPNHGRKGLGTALVVHGLEHIRQYGFSEIYLTTFSEIKWNAPFYRKLGFVILQKNEMPTVMVNILQAEHEHGLKNRVAMRLRISQETRRVYYDYSKLHADKSIQR